MPPLPAEGEPALPAVPPPDVPPEPAPLPPAPAPAVLSDPEEPPVTVPLPEVPPVGVVPAAPELPPLVDGAPELPPGEPTLGDAAPLQPVPASVMHVNAKAKFRLLMHGFMSGQRLQKPRNEGASGKDIALLRTNCRRRRILWLTLILGWVPPGRENVGARPVALRAPGAPKRTAPPSAGARLPIFRSAERRKQRAIASCNGHSPGEDERARLLEAWGTACCGRVYRPRCCGSVSATGGVVGSA